MERPSLSVAIFLVVLMLALALLPSNNIDQAQAAAAKAKRSGAAERILLPLVGRDGDKITLALQPHDLSPSVNIHSKEEAQAGESGDARLTEQHLRYIEHWDTISFEIIRAHKTGEWNGPFTELLRKNANIHSKEEALAVVNVVANPTLAQILLAHARSA
ncbi:unnamed protein product [Miscanthus lutarioriparius]|uniref:Uncharacterized protein n=1 Tax=Miscanthus lutarioriparius TaxID=422564 RepID=A0A811QU86_9POAL|nr:unnamed protein product [Miscanthus lutarioriparius]